MKIVKGFNIKQIKRVVAHHSAVVSITNQLEEVNRHHRDKNWGTKTKPAYQPISSLGYYVSYNLFIDVDGIATWTRAIGELGFDEVGDNCTRPDNCKNVSVCFAGNFLTDKPNEKQLNAYKREMGRLFKKTGVIPVEGHKDLPYNNTACPGKLLDYLPEITIMTYKQRLLKTLSILKEVLNLKKQLKKLKSETVFVAIPNQLKEFDKHKWQIENFFSEFNIKINIRYEHFNHKDYLKKVVPKREYEMDNVKFHNEYKNRAGIVGAVFPNKNYEVEKDGKIDINIGKATYSPITISAYQPEKQWEKKRDEEGVDYGMYLSATLIHEIIHVLIFEKYKKDHEKYQDIFHDYYYDGKVKDFVKEYLV